MAFYVLIVIGYWHDAVEACKEFYRKHPDIPQQTLKLIHINEESIFPCMPDASGEGKEFCVSVVDDETDPELETYIRRQLPPSPNIFYAIRGEPSWSWHGEIAEYVAALGWINLDAQDVPAVA